jgi:hypothetical protein
MSETTRDDGSMGDSARHSPSFPFIHCLVKQALLSHALKCSESIQNSHLLQHGRQRQRIRGRQRRRSRHGRGLGALPHGPMLGSRPLQAADAMPCKLV